MSFSVFSKPAFIASQAEEFFRRYHGESFLLTISFLEPHPPYSGIFNDMYPPQSLPLNYDNPEKEVYPAYLLRRIKNFSDTGYEGVKTSDRKALSKLIARYHGLVSLVDKYVGEIMKSLERYNLTENSLIIFTSDHGDMLYSQDRGWKCKPWRESIIVPFIARWPGHIPSNRVSNGLFSHLDMMPTLLSAAGAPGLHRAGRGGHLLRLPANPQPGIRRGPHR